MEEKYTKEETRYLKIGFSVIAALAVILAVFIWTNKKISQKHNGKYYSINAKFGRTDGMLVGDMVRMGGIDIGRVTQARFDDMFHAILTLEILESVRVPEDSSASIVSVGIMGPKYIEIEPGGSEDFIPKGGEFSYTQDAMVLEELIERIISLGKANHDKRIEEKSN